MSAAQADWEPAFGLTGVRRVFAIATAAILLTGVFIVIGFPYDRLTPRITQAVEATTGTRVVVRFFGGWDFEPLDAGNRLPAAIGYGKGVPMGGDLSAAPSGKSPTFLVAALKDPLGANLDRIQVVKGWLDAKGELHEQVYEVVWGDRSSGKAPWSMG